MRYWAIAKIIGSADVSVRQDGSESSIKRPNLLLGDNDLVPKIDQIGLYGDVQLSFKVLESGRWQSGPGPCHSKAANGQF